MYQKGYLDKEEQVNGNKEGMTTPAPLLFGVGEHVAEQRWRSQRKKGSDNGSIVRLLLKTMKETETLEVGHHAHTSRKVSVILGTKPVQRIHLLQNILLDD